MSHHPEFFFRGFAVNNLLLGAAEGLEVEIYCLPALAVHLVNNSNKNPPTCRGICYELKDYSSSYLVFLAAEFSVEATTSPVI